MRRGHPSQRYVLEWSGRRRSIYGSECLFLEWPRLLNHLKPDVPSPALLPTQRPNSAPWPLPLPSPRSRPSPGASALLLLVTRFSSPPPYASPPPPPPPAPTQKISPRTRTKPLTLHLPPPPPLPPKMPQPSARPPQRPRPFQRLLENGLDQGVYKANLVGKVGQRPVQKNLRSGRAVVLFSLGTGGIRNNNGPLDSEEPREYAERCAVQWHRVSVYPDRLSSLALKHVKPGSILSLEGNLETKVFSDPISGLVRRIREIAIRRDGTFISFPFCFLKFENVVVDIRYAQYSHQLQIIVLSFDAIAGCGTAKPYIVLALQTISRHFHCMRDAISGQIQATKKSLGEPEDLSGVAAVRYLALDTWISSYGNREPCISMV
ncbi:single-stranded DNA-binding protein [Musa troglodytarum]|uniref:Single-stranded DNA-binding protein n=1 Tax=Musa troglodytarum TaxID=320322 RepID=A0A9E7EBM4_9LILI|nr:single-stranded DNA-binding protein [Musa troglodytarum]